MSELLTARKIFVSYKYKDASVQALDGYIPEADTGYLTTPRHYVDYIVDLIGQDHIYKGEKSGEDASHLADDTIDSHLKAKIFDSSITIVLLSPNMWDKSTLQKDQWIPNEICYSLRDKNRSGQISKANGMLLVALPDFAGNYDYAVVQRTCGVRSWQTQSFFAILQKNMFNRKQPNAELCMQCLGNHHSGDDHSYIHPVKWSDFIVRPNVYIDHAAQLRDRLEEFKVVKEIDALC